MLNRRHFLGLSSLGMGSLFTTKATAKNVQKFKPIVLSTWPEGIAANAAAWKVLVNKGYWL